MSSISNFYDNLIALIGTTFTGANAKKELVDPYNISENNDIILKNGFGVILGQTSNPKGILGSQILLERTIELVFTKQHVGSDRDTAARRTTEKLLLEDELLMIKGIWGEGGTLSETVPYLLYSGNEGLSYVFSEKKNFLMLKMIFNVKYNESLI